MNLSKKRAGWLMALAAVLAGAFISKFVGFESGKIVYPKRSSLSQSLLQTASEMNSTLPMMVDEQTRLDNTLALDETFVYNYTLIHYNSGQITGKDINDFLFANILNKYCTAKSSLAKMGVASNYNYYGNDAKLIGVVKVTPGQCLHK
ncbi:hypothetical protein [Acerihabitans arboris]|uniref:Uncharacterized protein n=1 Tax=Acerihabitans arboris TaxID=2691583 RepID=A0A845SFN0_9GAMM|nr:hypothetical protein [Acerihabitans arboris]NDL61886.1 hypothetical protein [Acerihabitans arboris]